MSELTEKDAKALIKAMVIHTQFDGIEPSYRAYGDRCDEVEAEMDEQVQDIYDTFKSLKESNE